MRVRGKLPPTEDKPHVVVPNVVKMNWAREVQRWTPHRRATVISGSGADIKVTAPVATSALPFLAARLDQAIGVRGHRHHEEVVGVGGIHGEEAQHVLVRAEPTNAQRVYAALAAFGAPLPQFEVTPDDFASYDGVLHIGLPPRRVDIINRVPVDSN